MPAGSGHLAGGLSIILLGAAPFLIYRVMPGSDSQLVAGAMAALQIAVIACLFARNQSLLRRAALVLGSVAIVGGLVTLPGLSARFVGSTVGGSCHAAAYLSLLALFGSSLRPDREPVITGFARRLRRTMPDKVVRYTRNVTIAWCVFFAAQLIVSVGLLLLAPLTVWSAFVNLLNLPLVAAMALGEYGYRRILFRHEPHTSLIGTLSAMVSRP